MERGGALPSPKPVMKKPQSLRFDKGFAGEGRGVIVFDHHCRVRVPVRFPSYKHARDMHVCRTTQGIINLLVFHTGTSRSYEAFDVGPVNAVT